MLPRSSAMELNALSPYRNYVFLDTERCLHWCNQAIDYALSYYRRLTSQPITYGQLFQRLSEPASVRSLVYGAVAAEGTIRSTVRFDNIWDDERLVQYYAAVIEGLSRYLPESDIDPLTDDLDEEWPETRQPQLKMDPDFTGYIVGFKRLGFSLAEIGQMTQRGMHEYLQAVNGQPAEQKDWLNDGEI